MKPQTEAGKVLLNMRRHGQPNLFAVSQAVLAVEAEAVDEWLASEEAERRLAEALLLAEPPRKDHADMSDLRHWAGNILAALREGKR